MPYTLAEPTHSELIIKKSRFIGCVQPMADRASAQAVVDALVHDFGVAAGRLSAHGVGPLAPWADNQSSAGRARNRRVELVRH